MSPERYKPTGGGGKEKHQEVLNPECIHIMKRLNKDSNVGVTMSRIRRVNKVPLRTVALSEPLLEKMEKIKESKISWDCFINRVFHEWDIAKARFEDFEESIENLEAQIKAIQKSKELEVTNKNATILRLNEEKELTV